MILIEIKGGLKDSISLQLVSHKQAKNSLK